MRQHIYAAAAAIHPRQCDTNKRSSHCAPRVPREHAPVAASPMSLPCRPAAVATPLAAEVAAPPSKSRYIPHGSTAALAWLLYVTHCMPDCDQQLQPNPAYKGADGGGVWNNHPDLSAKLQLHRFLEPTTCPPSGGIRRRRPGRQASWRRYTAPAVEPSQEHQTVLHYAPTMHPQAARCCSFHHRRTAAAISRRRFGAAAPASRQPGGGRQH
jgi:hypothetical protein